MVAQSASNARSDATKTTRKDRRISKANNGKGPAMRSGSSPSQGANDGLFVGLEVVLANMDSEKLNGSLGKIASLCEDGRWRVRLRAHGKKRIAVDAKNLQAA